MLLLYILSFQASYRETPYGLCSLYPNYIYRDKNLRFNLDLRTLSLLSLRLNLNLRNFKPFE
ncbi:uncharacterized protein K441DRAFT_667333, partial [Cenococcum geophilum 1.58]|uniref:uncharacterized protein n=1 Tax=Cenococcum geophilum 1.58 TaxID=794803 RepID=UPI00358DE3CB